MPKKSIRASLAATVVAAFLLAPVAGHAQVERTVQAGADDDAAYGGKFFDQLRLIFGRFRNADLERAFQGATAIRCSELVSNRGEWRPVAFFNENRKLGDWYRASIEEVRSDLVVYIFKGSCSSDRAPLQLTTKFPIDESIDAYNAGRIPFERIDVNVNPPVTAVYDLRTESYTFDLPFLFLRERNDGGNIYSLIAPRMSDRYAREVTDHWDCKAVNAEDVTYQFLICRTNLVDRDPAARNQRRTASFGSSAFFILSDGKEATSSIKLSFAGDPDDPAPAAPLEPRAVERPDSNEVSRPLIDVLPPPSRDIPSMVRDTTPRPAAGIWNIPSPSSKIADVGLSSEFRLLFNLQTWNGKIGTPQLLMDQRMRASGAPSTTDTEDYCVWKPASSRAIDRLLGPDPDATTAFSITTQPRNGQTPPITTFVMKSFTGLQLGELQCVFPRAQTADNISFDQWVNIVGAHITLEVRR